MKKLILVAIAMFTLNGMAQEKVKTNNDKKTAKVKQEMSAEDIAATKTKKMTVTLDLTSEQQTKVYEVILENTKMNIETKTARKKLKASKDTMDKEDYKKLRMKIVEQKAETDKKMEEILTAEQLSKYKEMYGKKPKIRVKN